MSGKNKSRPVVTKSATAVKNAGNEVQEPDSGDDDEVEAESEDASVSSTSTVIVKPASLRETPRMYDGGPSIKPPIKPVREFSFLKSIKPPIRSREAILEARRLAAESTRSSSELYYNPGWPRQQNPPGVPYGKIVAGSLGIMSLMAIGVAFVFLWKKTEM